MLSVFVFRFAPILAVASIFFQQSLATDAVDASPAEKVTQEILSHADVQQATQDDSEDMADLQESNEANTDDNETENDVDSDADDADSDSDADSENDSDAESDSDSDSEEMDDENQNDSEAEYDAMFLEDGIDKLRQVFPDLQVEMPDELKAEFNGQVLEEDDTTEEDLDYLKDYPEKFNEYYDGTDEVIDGTMTKQVFKDEEKMGKYDAALALSLTR